VKDETGQPFATTGPAGYAPADLRAAYAVTGTGTSATIIAIVDAFGYPNAESDLATYRAQFGLPACTTANGCFKKVNQNGVQGNYPRANTGWSQETALDLDMASAMCPGCSILLVEATSSSLNNLAMAVNRAASMEHTPSATVTAAGKRERRTPSSSTTTRASLSRRARAMAALA